MRSIFNKKSLIVFVIIFSIIALPNALRAGNKPHPDIAELEKITSFLGLMTSYIDVIEKFQKIADNEKKAASYAVIEMKNLYKDSGDPTSAVKELEALLKKVSDRTVRNVIRFQLLELYKDMGNREAAVENLKSILNENL